MTSSIPYTSTHVFADSAFIRAAAEMQNKYREMSAAAFLDLLPEEGPPMPTVDFASFQIVVTNTRREIDMYNPFIEAMKPFLKPGWTLVNTSDSPDPQTSKIWVHREIKPDISLYETARYAGAKLTDASEMESCGEFKMLEEDEPFRFVSEDMVKEYEAEATKKAQKKAKKSQRRAGRGEHLKKPNRPRSFPEFERPALAARDTRGQLTLYLNAIQALQQRTRVFGFYVRKQHCRLLCHDRSGTLVTPLIDYTECDTFQKFFWRLTHAGRAERGFDTTFEPVVSTEPHAPTARKILGLQDDSPLFKVSVTNEYSTVPNTQGFYVSEPFTSTHTFPVGRSTRCFRAYDPQTKDIVLLKDTWRIAAYTPEHEVYAKLHQERVPHIPEVLAAGDIPGPLQQCGDDEDTSLVRRHIHYRIVLRQVGKALGEFSSTHELVTAVLDAFRAHRRAYEVGILHRDVSYGNIIIVDGHGYLIDWELVRLKDTTDHRAHERTGTWPFISIRLLRKRSQYHELRDDIESFVYVLLWTAIRYAPTAITPKRRATLLGNFDYTRIDPAGLKYQMVMSGRSFVLAIVRPKTKCFNKLLADLLENLRHAYDDELSFQEQEGDVQTDEAKEKQQRMLTHDWMETCLEKALTDATWQAEADNGERYPVEQDLGEPSQLGKRRKEGLSDYAEEQMTYKRKREDNLEWRHGLDKSEERTLNGDDEGSM